MLYTYNINNHEIRFYCNTDGTSSGFKHTTQLYIDGYYKIDATCYYYNRTWERFVYESVMLKAVDYLISLRKRELIMEYKTKNGYKRLTDKRTAELYDIFNKDETIIFYNNIHETI